MPPRVFYPVTIEQTSKTRQIRQQVRLILQSFVPGPEDIPQETLLIRDGVYCGHRFRVQQFEAIWFVEEDEIKFYGPGGHLIRTAQASELLYAPQVLQAA